MLSSGPPVIRRLLPLLFLVLLGCNAPATSDGAPAAATPTERPVGTQVGYQAPDWELPRLQGEGNLKLSEQRGKVVVISFWAAWCGPCRLEVPALEAAWKQYKTKDALFVGISLDDTADQANGFLRQNPVSYEAVLDEGGETVGNVWGAMSIPMTVLIDKQGVVRQRHIGYTPSALKNLLVQVDELMKE
jgi:cytochrome c biogenesis protein CcmG, thiol:disulfide interchange protein DsbE